MFGNTLYLYMYQPINDITGQKILRTIRQMLNEWQPRIAIDKIDLQIAIQEYAYVITIFYSVPKLQMQDSIQLIMDKNNIYI